MSYRLTSSTGSIEAVIDDNCGMNKFYSIANVLVKECEVKFLAKENFSDNTDWHFIYKGHNLLLHYNVYNGVSVCNRNMKSNEAVNEIAVVLESRYF